jgi:hypothetical protein
MTEESLCIRAVGNDLVILGNTDAATVAAIEHFSKTFLGEPRSELTVPADLDFSTCLLAYRTEHRYDTVTLKTSYSDYISDYEEQMLVSFNGQEGNVYLLEESRFDMEHSIGGDGAGRWDLREKYDTLTRFLDCPAGSFYFDASNKRASTLKLWLYVSDTDQITCDHDPGYGFQPNQATFFFRAVDGNGRVHNWNHTITNPGWHEIELSFNVHNGVSADFDYSNVAGFWVAFSTYGEVTVLMDDLRGVVYHTDHVPAEIKGERNARLISDCEYDALDGSVVQEWYGASYDLRDKAQGKSSMRNVSDGSVNDFRTIVADLDLEMNYDTDVLVFHLKLEHFSSIKSIMIELNQVQDQHEYQRVFSLMELRNYGLSAKVGTWSEIRIPLNKFSKQLHGDYGDTVQLHNFRFVTSVKAGALCDYHTDQIYLATK